MVFGQIIIHSYHQMPLLFFYYLQSFSMNKIEMATLMLRSGTSRTDLRVELGLPRLHCEAMLKGKIPVSANVAAYLEKKMEAQKTYE